MSDIILHKKNPTKVSIGEANGIVNIKVDTELSETSNNAISNKVVSLALKELAGKIRNDNPDNFGGIVCLTLGADMETSDVQNMADLLSDIINNQKHYILTIYDTVEDRFFGDCEVVQEFNGSVAIISNYISTTLSAYTLYYAFNKEENKYTRNKYSISIASKGSVTKLEANVNSLLDEKADVSHSHAISDVIDLQTTLNSKANVLHTHTIANISGLSKTLSMKALYEGGTMSANACMVDGATNYIEYATIDAEYNLIGDFCLLFICRIDITHQCDMILMPIPVIPLFERKQKGSIRIYNDSRTLPCNSLDYSIQPNMIDDDGNLVEAGMLLTINTPPIYDGTYAENIIIIYKFK